VVERSYVTPKCWIAQVVGLWYMYFTPLSCIAQFVELWYVTSKAWTAQVVELWHFTPKGWIAQVAGRLERWYVALVLQPQAQAPISSVQPIMFLLLIPCKESKKYPYSIFPLTEVTRIY